MYKIPEEQKLPTRPAHILVVDDDRGIREAIADLLTDSGYAVSTAVNGREALEVCRGAAAPDLVLLDLQMPVMDGIEFVRLKDADPALTDIPVCVMTAFARSHAIPGGASLTLSKPLGSTNLLKAVRRFCGVDSP